ncbi:hypothetical protein [Candidatus Neomicrothrix sp.]|uniref:hypothetical protein n=1 Tax=Candidatus Neomicrothrix sp. TaxID=2719034 RepID=UPI00259A0E3D|nr:hypothetical protein [Candidatus Microthrix sp.]HMS46332.1 hypothetical protein [Candidatus Microthrix sp.]
MGTTTIRVKAETHAQLLEMSKATGDSLIDTVDEAAVALRRKRFAAQATRDFEVLRRDPAAWRDYLGEFEATSVSDGLD